MLVKRYTNDLEAYNLYLKGRYHWNKLTEEGFNTGMDFFRKAIQKDPDYALAYSGIADCYCRLGWYSYLSPKDSFPEAKEAAEKALKMDNNLAEAYTSLGFVSMCYDRDYPKAEKEFKQAIYLNPGYAWSHSCYSIYLAIVGKHDESITEGKIALQLDPLTPMMLINLGMRYYYARKFQQAIVYIKKAIELDPGFEIAHFYLAWASMQMKKYDEASDEIQNAIKYFGRKNPEILSALGIILTLISQKNQAEKVVNEMFELAKEKYISPFWMTVLFFVLNRKELAFEWLEKSYKVHDCLMIFLNADPVFDPFKSDPKFQDMLKKMNLI
jgi:adenylate cyclase